MHSLFPNCPEIICILLGFLGKPLETDPIGFLVWDLVVNPLNAGTRFGWEEDGAVQVGGTDPGWEDMRVPGPPFSAREFIETQFNYRTDHGTCLKINFHCKNNNNIKPPLGLQPLPGAGSECLFLYFLWRVMLWNPKCLI